MAWGKSSPPDPAKVSTIRQLLPLIILFSLVAGVGFVVYQIYVGASKIRKNAEDSFAARNVVFTRDGMKVGVKHMENERYVDATQSWVVRAWNAAGPGSSSGPSPSAAATKRR
ncbi:hypothetical protein GGS20DRAFT_585813 [Poronia punctata]|nr:hypothetical protein GGS20DRAFT_585813 [Poronia punctata]